MTAASSLDALDPVRDDILSEITHLLVSEGSPERVLEAVADALRELVPYDTLTLYRSEPSLRVLRPELVRDDYADEILAMGPVPYGRGITGWAAETGQPQLVNDAHLDPRTVQVPGTPVEPEALIAVPLMARGELKGVLCLYRIGEQHGFGREEFDFAIRFAELAALAIDNAEIRARLETEATTDHLTGLYNHRYFHERLGEEIRRANRTRSSVSLLILDIDDFKRVNDVHGHLVGDQILQGVASVAREVCRLEDVICRIGGEEFAIILPQCSLGSAMLVAERLREAVSSTSFPTIDGLTASVGVATGPLHASSPRELIGCADLALLHAKAEGKNCVRVSGGAAEMRPVRQFASFTSARRKVLQAIGEAESAPTAGGGENGGWAGDGTSGRLASLAVRGERRPEAHLRMLESLSIKLNRLNDVREIGRTITLELRRLIDYHNCRVHLLETDGVTLVPVAFHGILSEYRGETFEALVTRVGQGITGFVAATGETYYTPNAATDGRGVTIPGTPEVEESLLAVPMKYGERVIGTLAVSKLGIDQFDDEDRRLLEALASNAAVTFENARLLQDQREAAEIASALLRLSQALTRATTTESVLDEAVAAVPSMLGCSNAQAWIRDPEGGHFRLVRHAGFPPEMHERLEGKIVAGDVAERFILSVQEPFVLSPEVVEQVPSHLRSLDGPREVLVAPFRWEPDGLGMLVGIGQEGEWRFPDRALRLARGIADIASLALGNARQFQELERAYLSTVEALAGAVEAKDQYTANHCRALAEMSIAVGKEMGLEASRLKALELGALFHDIGKIGVASDIIRKPGPLTAAERREMNRHPDVGAEILAPVPFLREVGPIVRASHERWDGKGYPNGIAGEDIPLEARIVFVCDAYHAMTTDRPYRAALPVTEAIRRLKLSSGTQFDPTVVSVFVRLHAEGRIHHH